MIIITYPGINVRQLAGRNNCIDLNPHNLYINDKRPSKWIEYYCNFAEDLSNQGYTVFVACLPGVIRRLISNCQEEVACIFPDESLEESWLTSMSVQFNITGDDRDFANYKSLQNNYIKLIIMLKNSGLKSYIIDNMNYSLNKIVRQFQSNTAFPRVIE